VLIVWKALLFSLMSSLMSCHPVLVSLHQVPLALLMCFFTPCTMPTASRC
jgi:hypothetical protein